MQAGWTVHAVTAFHLSHSCARSRVSPFARRSAITCPQVLPHPLTPLTSRCCTFFSQLSSSLLSMWHTIRYTFDASHPKLSQLPFESLILHRIFYPSKLHRTSRRSSYLTYLDPTSICTIIDVDENQNDFDDNNADDYDHVDGNGDQHQLRMGCLIYQGTS